MADRVSTLDPGYVTGDLSIFPVSLDDKDILYRANNDAITVLSQGMSYSSKTIYVESNEKFPDTGVIVVGNELIYYAKKLRNSFSDLKRGFAGSRQSPWDKGETVKHTVAAEPHNSVKDALINIERNVGVRVDPESESLNGILKQLENRFLSPKPIFSALPNKGAPPLTVRFQNFSGGHVIRCFWDFGDGGTSTEVAPTHTYLAEGEYTVKLNVITSLGAQGSARKTSYIKISEDYRAGYMYHTPEAGNTSTEFTFVDQTLGEIVSRYWAFGDGTFQTELDPDLHVVTHTYEEVGEYVPTLIIVFSDNRVKSYTGETIVIE